MFQNKKLEEEEKDTEEHKKQILLERKW